MKRAKARIHKLKILFAAQDIGGFQAIAPVMARLRKRGAYEVFCCAASEAAARAKRTGIACKNCGGLGEARLRDFFTDVSPDLLCVSTSFGNSLDKKLMRIAKAKKVLSLAIIDFWSHYRDRFDSLPDGLPDKICVMDGTVKKEMIIAGFPARVIEVTGNPFFDTFRTQKRNLKKGNAGHYIVFFEQPFSELFPQDDHRFFGFDEIEVWQDIAAALSRLEIKDIIKIKFHPRSRKINKFDEINRRHKLNVEIDERTSVEDLIEGSKLAMGMNSAVLFQAAMAGKKVLSYQPNLQQDDPLVSNKLGLSLGIYRKDELEKAIKSLLKKGIGLKNKKKIDYYVNNDATGKVLKIINKVLQK
ncbi:TPA: hypothetical protein DCP81_00230 [Candidatus Azambacteria bacterium]|nr:hypothetical protein [Candidatus Azambacteria bacterium]